MPAHLLKRGTWTVLVDVVRFQACFILVVAFFGRLLWSVRRAVWPNEVGWHALGVAERVESELMNAEAVTGL